MRCSKCADAVYSVKNGQNKILNGKWICENCGMIGQELTQDSNRAIWLAEQPKVPQIAKDFANYNFPGAVNARAIDIYIDITDGDTLKGNKRKAMMCKCVYAAYTALGIPKDPIMLARLFGVTDAQLRKAQNEFSERVYYRDLMVKYPKKYFSAKELLEEFLVLFDVEDAPRSDLETIIDKIYENIMLQNKFKSRDVAICVVYWYVTKTNACPNLDIDAFRAKTCIAKSTMKKLLDIITKL